MSEQLPLYVSQQTINECANLNDLIQDIRNAYLNSTNSTIPQRTLIINKKPFSAFVAMPGYSNEEGIFITKVGAVTPKTGSVPSVRSLVVAYSKEANQPAILLDGQAITNLKCRAISALVTACCTPEDADVLAIIGSGTQAQQQLIGISSVRNLREIRIYSRSLEHVASFIQENQSHVPTTHLVMCSSIEDAFQNATIIVTTTTSITPLFSDDIVPKNAVHINCMGAHTPDGGELPEALINRAHLIVEDVDMAVSEAGPMHQEAISIEQLIQSDLTALKQQITVFRSTGHALLDLITVIHVMKRLNIQK